MTVWKNRELKKPFAVGEPDDNVCAFSSGVAYVWSSADPLPINFWDDFVDDAHQPKCLCGDNQ